MYVYVYVQMRKLPSTQVAAEGATIRTVATHMTHGRDIQKVAGKPEEKDGPAKDVESRRYEKNSTWGR